MICLEKNIVEQLVDIYFNEEWWDTPKMSFEKAIKYHQERLDSGNIHVIEKDGEVLGYYERYIRGNTALCNNVWVKDGYRHKGIFKELYRHFCSTLPEGIKYITGERQSIGGKFQKFLIKGARYGR